MTLALPPAAILAANLPNAAAVCAVEGGTCSLTSGTTATIYYGAHGTFLSQAGVTGAIGCNVASFGSDPVPGVLKACYAVVNSGGGAAYTSILPNTAAQCAGESGTCTVAAGATATVYYGAGTSYLFKTGITGSLGCNTNAFAADPDVNVLKSCYVNVLPPGVAACAIDFGTCALLPGITATVYYGVGSTYLTKAGVTSSFSCQPSTFGSDPVPNVVKTCYVQAASTAGGFIATALPAGATACTGEGGTCSLLVGTVATVYYGVNSQFYAKQSVTGSFGCNVNTFGGDPDPYVVKACYAVTTSPGGEFLAAATPSGAGQCAGEGGTCVLLPGTVATVYYGAGTNFAVREGVTVSIACSVPTFGFDADPNVVKACYAVITSSAGAILTNASPSGATQCATAETGVCIIAPGTSATVYYGAGSGYYFKTSVTGSIGCNQFAFGGDPDRGVVKACYSTGPILSSGYVNLTSYFNVPAISTDSSSVNPLMYNQTGVPYTYSQTQLGTQVVWNGSVFVFGAAGVNNAVSNNTVALPNGSYGRLDILASRINGSRATETFTVTYTDGTTSSFSQGMSDWWNNSRGTANYPGESTVAYMTYLHNNGGQAASLFGYTFALNASKIVKSITLPADANVGILAMNLGAANVAPAIPAAGAAVSVVTHHNDTWRTGLNAAEYQLTPATVGNVTGSQVFGRLGTVTLDEEVSAQPLVVPNVSVTGDPNAGTHDVVYVVTKNNTVYAIDPLRRTILTQRNLGASVPNPLGAFNQGVAGMRSTPVIDASKGVIYAMAYVQASGGPQYVLHMLSLSNLTDVVPAVTVAAKTSTTTGSLIFNPTYEMQRPALLETGGRIVVAFGSWGDLGANLSRGWVLSFDANTLALNTAGVELTDRLGGEKNNYYLSSVWMAGAGPAADENGYVYFATGNSDSGSYDGINNIQESVVKLQPSNGQVLSLYTPNNVNYLDSIDQDLGSGGVLLLPNTNNRLGAILSKDGIVRVFNRDNLGGNNDASLLTTAGADACTCGMSYFNDGQDRLVTSGEPTLRLFTWQTGATMALIQQGTAPMPGKADTLGSFTSVSSGGSSNAIIWVVPAPFVNNTNSGLNLMAFSATPVNGTLPLLYLAPAGGWLYGGGGNYHIPPTVANGRVYVASNKLLTIFGLGGTR